MPVTIIFFVFLFVSAFFSSAEIALLSLSPVELKGLSKKSTRNSKRISLLLSNPHALFVAVRFAALITQILLVATAI
ncbi:MAG: CNNM domain-containing protein, partial [bacterium]